MQNIDIFVVKYIFQILSILIFLQYFVNLQYFFFGNPAVQISNLFQAGDLPMLMRFNRLDEICCFHEAFMSTGIQPGKALTKQLHI